MTKNSIAFVFDDLTEFFVMQKAIDRLNAEKIPVDIIVPYDSGYNGLAEHTLKKIEDMGYNPKKDVSPKKKYQILLTPYPGLEVVKRANFVYHIQYPYGPLSPKPIPTYTPNYTIYYDAIFSFNTYDTDYLGAYGSKVYAIPYWRYEGFKKHKSTKTKKPNLLILPTFGSDTSCIQAFTEPVIKNLKQNYHIITKAHHAVHFSIDGKDNMTTLHKIADELYDSDMPINRVLEHADITISDNSGAIFESICAGVPTVLFAPDINSRKIGKMNTPQFDFTQQGYFPYTNTANKLLDTIRSVDKYKKKQSELKKKLFLSLSDDPVKPFIEIIKQYLNPDMNIRHRKILHDILVEEWSMDKRKIKDLSEAVEALKNSTSWKITRPLRRLKRRK